MFFGFGLDVKNVLENTDCSYLKSYLFSLWNENVKGKPIELGIFFFYYLVIEYSQLNFKFW